MQYVGPKSLVCDARPQKFQLKLLTILQHQNRRGFNNFPFNDK